MSRVCLQCGGGEDVERVLGGRVRRGWEGLVWAKWESDRLGVLVDTPSLPIIQRTQCVHGAGVRGPTEQRQALEWSKSAARARCQPQDPSVILASLPRSSIPASRCQTHAPTQQCPKRPGDPLPVRIRRFSSHPPQQFVRRHPITPVHPAVPMRAWCRCTGSDRAEEGAGVVEICSTRSMSASGSVRHPRISSALFRPRTPMPNTHARSAMSETSR
jgi:hypothetical protein